ncbi:hypothetical protein ACQEVY_03675 [Streptomyces sp. CA-288835]|uniref:hypothetical protein n=1 Tax=Streptomyces sp. CA-288835 TaxID=3240069 RepID=UPI003D8E1D96
MPRRLVVGRDVPVSDAVGSGRQEKDLRLRGKRPRRKPGAPQVDESVGASCPGRAAESWTVPDAARRGLSVMPYATFVMSFPQYFLGASGPAPRPV